LEDGFYYVSGKLSNSQSNIYGYISTKGRDMYIKGIFIIFLIWGGKLRRDLYNKVRN